MTKIKKLLRRHKDLPVASEVRSDRVYDLPFEGVDWR